MITSESNPTVKHIKGLQQKKNRVKYKQFVIEGLRIIQEALQHQESIAHILYSDSLLKLKGGEAFLAQIQDSHQPIYISDKLLEMLTETEHPQGILAVVEMREYSLESLFKKDQLFFVVLDRIQDPGNLGTIIRTAEGAGVDGVFLTKGCVDPYNSKTLRSTMGAIFHLPVVQWEEEQELIPFLKEWQVKVIATDLSTNQFYDTISYKGKTALVFGNEANGIDSTLLEQADEIVKIPIVGKIESLNASVAAGILIYKALENRGF